jgi:hypothetical protein
MTKQLAVLGAGLTTFPAFAALPPAITTALSDGLTDTGAVALGVTLIVFGIAVFKWLRSSK